jgi:hypothetical protein
MRVETHRASTTRTLRYPDIVVSCLKPFHFASPSGMPLIACQRLQQAGAASAPCQSLQPWSWCHSHPSTRPCSHLHPFFGGGAMSDVAEGWIGRGRAVDASLHSCTLTLTPTPTPTATSTLTLLALNLPPTAIRSALSYPAVCKLGFIAEGESGLWQNQNRSRSAAMDSVQRPSHADNATPVPARNGRLRPHAPML